jgi:hypothetical protein
LKFGPKDRGAKLAELPVWLLVKVELMINLRTAKLLFLTILPPRTGSY